MIPISFFFTFIIVWFLILLMVLPWGNRPCPQSHEGAASGAPLSPRLKMKMVWTTGLSFLTTCLLLFWGII